MSDAAAQTNYITYHTDKIPDHGIRFIQMEEEEISDPERGKKRRNKDKLNRVVKIEA